MKKVAFVSFGCKVNRAETETMITQLAAYGAAYTPEAASADIVIVNTCAVTEKAQKDGEKYLHALKKKNPACQIAATGCTAELYKDSPEKLAADFVIPNSSKEQALRIIFDKIETHTPQAALPLPSSTGTRAFLKIQDGCDAFCTYCIIPSLRGRPVSRNEEDILKEFRHLLKEGYKEIVLTGIHIGLYGIDSGTSLPCLLNRLAAIEGGFRIRLTSLYVNEVTEGLIQAVINAGGKIAPHFHLSLQSGSGEILRRMGRKYKPEEAGEIIRKLKKEIQNATIGADIITGFPGETEALFQETVTFLKKTAIDFLHIFPYSVRPGTPAAIFDNQLPGDVKQARAKILRRMGTAKLEASSRRLIGQLVKVLTEKDNRGHSAGYHLIHLPENTPPNIFAEVLITERGNEGSLKGRII